MESSESVIGETDQIDMDGRASLPEPSTVEARDGSLARPFESMPNEIIGSILEEAHNQYYRSLPPRASWSPSSSSYRIEDVSSQVCSLWRGLAQHLPRLWSKFYLCRTNMGFIPKGEYDRLNLYLTRSVDEDLDIVFDSSGLNEKEPVLMVMLDLIPPHLRRLRRFVLHSDETNFVEVPFYKSLTGVSAPRLEHFDVSTGKDPNLIAGTSRYHCLPKGWNPRILTEGPLSIKYLRLDSSSAARFRPPFDHLVHFSLHCTVACCGLFLSWVCLEQVFSLPFIETISIWGPVPDHLARSPPLRCIEAKRLKHFRTGDRMERTLFSYLFNCVSAPLLESITSTAVPIPVPPFPSAGSLNPFPSLKSLYLVDVVVEDRDNWDVYFRHLAMKTASITHLSISSTSTMPRDRRMDIVHFLESSFAEAPWPNVERVDFNLTKAVDYPTSEELAWSSSRGWGKLSCVRFPSHSLPTNTPSGLAIEPLTQVLPDWPPNYDFPSPVLTNEFSIPVVPASSSP